jgi:hypothetical protein
MLVCLLRIKIRSRTRQRLYASILLCVSFLSFLLPQNVSAGESSGIPRGVFSLAQVGQPADSGVLANPVVDGISVRQAWRKLESSPGAYDWSFLDSEVARAGKAGKVVLLRVLSEGPATPEWALSDVQTFRFGDKNPFHPETTGRIAVYWDQTYLARKKAMIQGLGAHFSANPAVRIVAAISASNHSGDWGVPHTRVDISNWHATGYSSEKMIDVCKQIIDVTMQSSTLIQTTSRVPPPNMAGVTIRGDSSCKRTHWLRPPLRRDHRTSSTLSCFGRAGQTLPGRCSGIHMGIQRAATTAVRRLAILRQPCGERSTSAWLTK